MNNKTLIWTLIVAVPVGLAALVTGYIYRDTGRLPFQSGPEVAATPSVSGDSATTEQAAGSDTGTKTQSAETDKADASDEAPAAETASTGPSFDVVGVEPTGETVVAGRSVAGAIVALTANGKVVGKSIANEVGEWTIILDEPLKPGDYDVGLEVHDDTGKAIATSEERLAVSLPEGGKEQPLVVLNTPDGPSDVLQKPEAEQQVASITSTGEGSQTAATTDSAEGTATEASGSTSATETASAEPAAGTSASQQTASRETSEQPAGTSEKAAVASTDTTSSGTGTADPETAGNGAAVSTAEASGQAASAETEVASTSSGAAPAAVATQDSGADVAQSSQNVPSDVPAAAPDAPTVTVEAVESEKDKVFVAGTGEPGSSVRVYVGDEFQGEAKVGSGGKWLIEGGKNISEGNVEVRADLIGEDGSSVDARAAVTFEKEQDKQIVLTKVVASGEGAGADGQGAEVKKSLPVVIIRKGDNLWRISRRLYGEGVRYTTIYKANQQQIRNPDLIYPGQVFLTPEGDLSWPKPDENNG